MQASDVMTMDVVSLPPDATILQAARLMLQRQISGLPVINAAGGLVGIITEGDFLRRRETGTERRRKRWIEFLTSPGKLADEYVHSSGRIVHEVMSHPVHTVSEDTPLDEVVDLMERHRIKRVPVMRGTRVVGMITRANLIRAMIKTSREPQAASADDAAIRERLLAELKKQPWAAIALIDVRVRNGVVTLTGVISDERERQALRVAAENISGVKKVIDEFSWVEPVSGMVGDFGAR